MNAHVIYKPNTVDLVLFALWTSLHKFCLLLTSTMKKWLRDVSELMIRVRMCSTRMKVVAIFTPSQRSAAGGAEHHSSTQLVSRNRR